MSEDSNILTVDENGLVTGVKQGSCKIIAYSTEYSNLKSSVYIQSGYSYELNVYCENSTYMLKPGETLQLYTTKHNEEQGVTEPYNDVTYSVRLYKDEEQVATVDENGLLTAIAEGFAFVEIVDNNDFKMTDCRIEIKNEITVDSLVIISGRLFDYYLNLDIDTDKGQLPLKTVSMPGNRLYENVTYSVDDESIATIDAETGLITAIRNGTVEVTATSKTDDSLKANAYINIYNQKS